MGAALETVSAPFDGEVRTLSASIARVDGREGYYAREKLVFAARDRDELLRVLLVRDREIERCVRKTPERDRALRDSASFLAALSRGANPSIPTQGLVVTDDRTPPRAMPFTDRVCSGHGFEGALSCFVFGGFGAILDVVSLPLGTWFWAGRTEHIPLALAQFPPPADRMKEIGELVRRRALEGLGEALK